MHVRDCFVFGGLGKQGTVHPGKSNTLAVLQAKWHPREGLYFLTIHFFLQAYEKSYFIRLRIFWLLSDFSILFWSFKGTISLWNTSFRKGLPSLGYNLEWPLCDYFQVWQFRSISLTVSRHRIASELLSWQYFMVYFRVMLKRVSLYSVDNDCGWLLCIPKCLSKNFLRQITKADYPVSYSVLTALFSMLVQFSHIPVLTP